MSDVLSTCRKTWKRLGVESSIAEEMASELAADLEAAAEEQISAEAYVGHDAQAFATGWAEARGAVRPRPLIATTVSAALVGAIPGAGFGLFIAYGTSSEAFIDIFGTAPSWLVLGLYALGAVFAYGGALAAVGAALRLREDPAVGDTLRLLAAHLPLGVAAAIVASIAFAASRDFLTTPRVVIADALVAAFVFGASVALLRLLAFRRSRAAPAQAARTAVRG
jgi:hypothetical protein